MRHEFEAKSAVAGQALGAEAIAASHTSEVWLASASQRSGACADRLLATGADGRSEATRVFVRA